MGNEELGLLTKNKKFFQKCLAGPRRLTCPKCLSKSGTGSRRCWFDALPASAQEHNLVVTLNTALSPPLNAQMVYSWENENHNSVIFLIHKCTHLRQQACQGGRKQVLAGRPREATAFSQLGRSPVGTEAVMRNATALGQCVLVSEVSLFFLLSPSCTLAFARSVPRFPG